MKTVGTRAQVWHGTAKKTSGGLTKKDLFKRKGRIKSKRASKKAKKNNNLKNAGWTFKKGEFGAIRIEDKQTAKKGKKGKKGKKKQSGGYREIINGVMYDNEMDDDSCQRLGQVECDDSEECAWGILQDMDGRDTDGCVSNILTTPQYDNGLVDLDRIRAGSATAATQKNKKGKSKKGKSKKGRSKKGRSKKGKKGRSKKGKSKKGRSKKERSKKERSKKGKKKVRAGSNRFLRDVTPDQASEQKRNCQQNGCCIDGARFVVDDYTTQDDCEEAGFEWFYP